jgi:hypothetical protein
VAVSTPRRRRIATAPGARPYNSRLQHGRALFDDMRLLVRHWHESGVNGQHDAVVAENVLGKPTRARAADTLRRASLSRFVHGSPPHAWKIVGALEDRDLPVEMIRPAYYWLTARTERLLYDFVSVELLQCSKS